MQFLPEPLADMLPEEIVSESEGLEILKCVRTILGDVGIPERLFFSGSFNTLLPGSRFYTGSGKGFVRRGNWNGSLHKQTH